VNGVLPDTSCSYASPDVQSGVSKRERYVGETQSLQSFSLMQYVQKSPSEKESFRYPLLKRLLVPQLTRYVTIDDIVASVANRI
jgi:hypothetical protein